MPIPVMVLKNSNGTMGSDGATVSIDCDVVDSCASVRLISFSRADFSVVVTTSLDMLTLNALSSVIGISVEVVVSGKVVVSTIISWSSLTMSDELKSISGNSRLKKLASKKSKPNSLLKYDS